MRNTRAPFARRCTCGMKTRPSSSSSSAATTTKSVEAALAEAQKAERVVVAAFVKRAASTGTVALPEAQAELVRKLVATKKPLAVVAFAGPYLIRQFEDAPAYMVAYAIEEVAQAAAARAIFGETDINGRLPVTVPGLFELGAGLKLAARK